jgi:hypothetical protein
MRSCSPCSAAALSEASERERARERDLSLAEMLVIRRHHSQQLVQAPLSNPLQSLSPFLVIKGASGRKEGKEGRREGGKGP